MSIASSHTPTITGKRVDDPILYRVLCTTMVSCNVFRTSYAVIGFTAAAIMHRVLSIALHQASQTDCCGQNMCMTNEATIQ